MIKRIISVAMASALLAASALSVANEESAQPEQPAAINLNPMDPAVIAGFINPATHKQYHDAVANPASWTQFMQPQFYMQMMDPAKAMQWMNPASYQVFMNPATYMYWMNPNTLMQEVNSVPYGTYMNPNAYTQFMNPNMMMGWMNPAAYTTTAANTAGMQNMFDFNSWFNMMQPQQEAGEAAAEEEAAS